MSSRLQKFCREQIQAKLRAATLKQIAEQAGVNHATVKRISEGQPHEAKPSVLEKLYAYLTGRELSL